MTSQAIPTPAGVATLACPARYRNAYMAGWDAALGAQAAFPVRYEFRRAFVNGKAACMAGLPLPEWYAEWKESH